MEHFSHLLARPRGEVPIADSPVGRSPCVGALMSDIEIVVSATAPLRHVAPLVRGVDAAALVIGLSHQPLGLATEAAVKAVAAQNPQQWEKRRCASLITGAPDPLSLTDSVQEVLGRYRSAGAQPLLVLDGSRAVGILYPDPVFSWCLTQPASIFDALGFGRDPS